MNLLIIEDNPTDMKLFCTILRAEGHEIWMAESAEIALQILASKLPQLILTDLSLLGMDGLAFTRRLKTSSATAAIPVVAVTAYPEILPKRSAQRAAGFAAFISKPIDPVALPALLTAACTHN